MKQELTQHQTALKSTKSSLENFLKIANTGNFDTIEKALDSKLPSIALMQKKYGNKVMEMVAEMVVGTIEFFNVPKLSAMQVKMTTKFICGSGEDEYDYLNFADINLCFENGMRGKYGKLFNRVDGQIILMWLDKYALERAKLIEERVYQKHDALTAHEKERKYDGFIDKLWGDHIEQRARRKPNTSPISDNQKFNKKTLKWEVK